MFRIKITPSALHDLKAAYRFYDDQSAGLGEHFASNLRSEIDTLKHFAGIHRVLYQDYHRLLTRKFPYAVYYTLDQNTVTVWAVVDCRRNPSWIKSHLKRIN